MAAKKKLPYVQRRQLADGSITFRGWAVSARRRVYGKWRDSEQDAYRDALRMRDASAEAVVGETLDQACDRVFEELRTKRTDGSLRWYRDQLRAVRKLIPGKTPLTKITPEALEEFVRERLSAYAKKPNAKTGDPGRRVKPATVNSHLRALHRVFAVAIRRGIVRENPVRLVDRPRADQPAIDWFTDSELRTLLRQFDQDTQDVLLLFALTGIRRSEAARLHPVHVRLKLRQLVVPGKNATRVVPLSEDLDGPLRRLLAKADEHLLPGGTRAIDTLFRVAKKQSGERRLHPHALRHTFGTALIRSGVRPDVVMRLMGHRVMATTLRYVHEVGEDGVQAVSLLRLVQPDAPGQARPG